MRFKVPPQVLRPGDIFLSTNPMWMGRAINAVQKFTSKDNNSEYSHAGIILNYVGTTFEALWTNRKQSLFKAYCGQKILIARHKEMTPERFAQGWDGIRHHEGKWYAGHRLLFFLVCPPLAKYLSLGLAVCSEMVMKFLCKAGLAIAWRGWNPDDVADMVKHWTSEYKIIFEDICPANYDQLQTLETEVKHETARRSRILL